MAGYREQDSSLTLAQYHANFPHAVRDRGG
jgi:hypothetical protein